MKTFVIYFMASIVNIVGIVAIGFITDESIWALFALIGSQLIIKPSMSYWVDYFTKKLD